MKRFPLISIIVPVYNVEIYLERCIDSILSQTYENLEVILIDDGSTDASGRICDAYKEQDSRVIVIHQKNGGLSFARNTGIEAASGEFISCIDSDDFVAPDFVKTLYHNIEAEDADISVCNFNYYYEDGSIKSHGSDKMYKVCAPDEAIELIGRARDFTASAWGKLYRKKLFKEVCYPVGKLCEDQFVIYKLIMQCTKIVFDTSALYHYLIRSGSIMTSANPKKMLDAVEAAKENEKLIKKVYPQLAYICVLRNLEAYFEVISRCTLKNLQESILKNTAYEARRYVMDHAKDIFFDRNHIISKKYKLYCIALMIHPGFYVWLRNRIKGKGED